MRAKSLKIIFIFGLVILAVFFVWRNVNESIYRPDFSFKSYFKSDEAVNANLADDEKDESLIKEQEAVVEPDMADKDVWLEVPFVLQAPFSNWDDPMFQDACEEAAIFMAILWTRGENSVSKQEAYDEIKALSDFQLENYGEYRDRSLTDTAQLMKDYYAYTNISVYYDVSLEDIKSELFKGNLIIVPINGQFVNNPYYTPPGPERHMLVLIGYNTKTNEFITNDAGIGRGKDYQYPKDILYQGIRDFETGYHEPFIGVKKNMLVVRK